LEIVHTQLISKRTFASCTKRKRFLCYWYCAILQAYSGPTTTNPIKLLVSIRTGNLIRSHSTPQPPPSSPRKTHLVGEAEAIFWPEIFLDGMPMTYWKVRWPGLPLTKPVKPARPCPPRRTNPSSRSTSAGSVRFTILFLTYLTYIYSMLLLYEWIYL
jgi:hypothetical protein